MSTKILESQDPTADETLQRLQEILSVLWVRLDSGKVFGERRRMLEAIEEIVRKATVDVEHYASTPLQHTESTGER